MSVDKTPAIRINGGVVRLIRGDITDLEVDAFVYYTQPDLSLGAGFGGAIALRGGRAVQEELDRLGPLEMGEAVVSGAGNMKADHIIHAVGPRFQEPAIEAKLRAAMESSLRRAEEHDIETLAFPAMGAGYYGIPPDLCARVTLDSIVEHLEGGSGLKEIIICVLDTPQHEAFRDAMSIMEPIEV